MEIWWEGLTLLEQIFFIIALPSTLIILIQTIMLIFGGGFGAESADGFSDFTGSSDAGELGTADIGRDGPPAEDIGVDTDGLRIFSIRGVMSFLTIFGWSGYILLGMGIHTAIAIGVSVLLGTAALFAMAYMIRGLMKLQESGTADYNRAIGKIGRVYLTIPAAGGGQGKINLLFGETLRELWAVTEGSEPIPTGTSVRIKSLAGGVFTVEKE